MQLVQAQSHECERVLDHLLMHDVMSLRLLLPSCYSSMHESEQHGSLVVLNLTFISPQVLYGEMLCHTFRPAAFSSCADNLEHVLCTAWYVRSHRHQTELQTVYSLLHAHLVMGSEPQQF